MLDMFPFLSNVKVCGNGRNGRLTPDFAPIMGGTRSRLLPGRGWGTWGFRQPDQRRRWPDRGPRPNDPLITGFSLERFRRYR